MDEAFEAEKARQTRLQDTVDFNNEMAGVSTGRALRFSTKEEFQRRAAKAKGEDPDADRLAGLMLAEIAYERTYQRVMQELDIQDRAADMALHDIDRDIAQNRRQHQRMLDNAYRLPDGRRVFLTEDGTAVYDEQGRRLDQADVARLPTPELERRPRWERMVQNKTELQSLQKERQAVERYKAEGDELKHRVQSGELSKEELEDIERERQQGMPERMRPHVERLGAENLQPGASPNTLSQDERREIQSRSGSAATAILGKKDFPNAPDAGASFRAAASTKPGPHRPPMEPVNSPDFSGPGPS